MDANSESPMSEKIGHRIVDVPGTYDEDDPERLRLSLKQTVEFYEEKVRELEAERDTGIEKASKWDSVTAEAVRLMKVELKIEREKVLGLTDSIAALRTHREELTEKVRELEAEKEKGWDQFWTEAEIGNRLDSELTAERKKVRELEVEAADLAKTLEEHSALGMAAIEELRASNALSEKRRTTLLSTINLHVGDKQLREHLLKTYAVLIQPST